VNDCEMEDDSNDMAKYAYHRLDANAKEIIAALEAGGCSVESIGKPVDIAVGIGGKSFLFEIKTAKGKLRESQVKFLDRWRGHVGILRSLDDVQLFLATRK
jgi:hypothetical protein